MTVTEEEWLHRWERKVLRRISGAVNVQGIWRIRTNMEIQQIYGEPDIVTDIKQSRTNPVVRGCPENVRDSTLKNIFRGRHGGRRRRGWPRK